MRWRQPDKIRETLLLQRVTQWQSHSCWVLNAAEGRCLCVGALAAVLCVAVEQGVVWMGDLSHFTPLLSEEGEQHLILSKLFVAQTKGGRGVWRPNMNKDEIFLFRNVLGFCSRRARVGSSRLLASAAAAGAVLSAEACPSPAPYWSLLYEKFITTALPVLSALISVWKLNRLLKWHDTVSKMFLYYERILDIEVLKKINNTNNRMSL